MSNIVKLLRSTTTGHSPGSLASGQIAINEADARLFYLGSDGTTIKGFRPPVIGQLLYSSEGTPIDCLPCDGSSYANASYPALQALIGNSYGQITAFGSGTSDVSNYCFAACYAQSLGLFLAGGGVSASNANKIWSSTDGHTYTSRDTTASFGQTVGLDWSGSLALAVSNFAATGKCLNSSNGTSWSAKTSLGAALKAGCLKWGSSLFVACDVGTPFAIKTTTDGTTWTSRTSPASGAEGAAVNGLASDGTNFVLLSTASGVWYVSSNGTSWTRKTGGPAWTDGNQSIIYANGYFLLQASGGLYYSKDAGATWTKIYFPGELQIVNDSTTGGYGSSSITFGGIIGSYFILQAIVAATSAWPSLQADTPGTTSTILLCTKDFINFAIAGTTALAQTSLPAWAAIANDGVTCSFSRGGIAANFNYFNFDTDASHFRVPKLRPRLDGRQAFIKAL